MCVWGGGGGGGGIQEFCLRVGCNRVEERHRNFSNHTHHLYGPSWGRNKTCMLRFQLGHWLSVEFLQLAQTPDKTVVLQALGGLLNVTVSETLREDAGKKGAVKVAMG